MLRQGNRQQIKDGSGRQWPRWSAIDRGRLYWRRNSTPLWKHWRALLRLPPRRPGRQQVHNRIARPVPLSFWPNLISLKRAFSVLSVSTIDLYGNGDVLKKFQVSARQGINRRESGVYTSVHEHFETVYNAESCRMWLFQFPAAWKLASIARRTFSVILTAVLAKSTPSPTTRS